MDLVRLAPLCSRGFEGITREDQACLLGNRSGNLVQPFRHGTVGSDFVRLDRWNRDRFDGCNDTGGFGTAHESRDVRAPHRGIGFERELLRRYVDVHASLSVLHRREIHMDVDRPMRYVLQLIEAGLGGGYLYGARFGVDCVDP